MPPQDLTADEFERRLRKIYSEMDANERTWNEQMGLLAADLKHQQEYSERARPDPSVRWKRVPVSRGAERCTRLHITEAEVLTNEARVPLMVKALLAREFPFLLEEIPVCA